MSQAVIGSLLHGHRLHEKLGEGRYGIVWRAEFQGRPVALKIFSGGRPRAQLKREAFAQHALGNLEGADGRWFPRIEHVDLDAEPPWLRMELIDGAPLEELLSNPALSLDERLAVGEKILQALAAVHRHDFVHGDLSPLNVMVGADRRVRLIDVGFGAAIEEGVDIALSTTSEDAPEAGVASPLYSAPERFRLDAPGGLGRPADVFSFGKLLYRLITGEQPFVIKPVSLKFRALGAGWDDFLFRCLEEKPEARFADADAALSEYRRIWRPALAPGEYRVECPECRAAQSIAGGWAGERFDCRRCGRRIEVLFYDDASRYATTATVAPNEPPPPILFLDGEAPPRARKFCLRCGGEMKAEAKKCRHCSAWVDEDARRLHATRAPRPAPPASLVAPALFTLLAYFVFWLPGAILNWHFLAQARRDKAATGLEPEGATGLRALIWIFFYLPLIGLGIAAAVGLAATLFAVRRA